MLWLVKLTNLNTIQSIYFCPETVEKSGPMFSRKKKTKNKTKKKKQTKKTKEQQNTDKKKKKNR